MDKILGLIRHALTFGGGFAVSAGHLTEGSLDSLTGAVITLVGIAWSIYDKQTAK